MDKQVIKHLIDLINVKIKQSEKNRDMVLRGTNAEITPESAHYGGRVIAYNDIKDIIDSL